MSKIRTEHLRRQALIYVRQSTLTQVRENLGSQERQYDLVRRALDLGWVREQVTVIDQDQGRSGASAEGRDGFQQLVADVGMGHAGAVFSLEASRLARSCVDWYRLLEICALTQTLVVDEESVYDPSHYNDRLLLGLKGTMSEAEPHWLRSRLKGGRLKKAESGELRIERAKYEADLARRRYAAVDPENRLVARSLEQDWNEKLVALERLERKYATAPRPAQLVASPKERARILSLALGFPTIWQASTTSNAERKQLLRFLIKDVTLTRREEDIHLGVRWQTGAVSECTIARRKRVDEIWRTSDEVIARIRTLAAHKTDRQIAAQLNVEGLTTGAGQAFDRVRVRRVRLKYEIPASCPEMPHPREDRPRGDGRFSAKAATRLLNVSLSTINIWCRSGKLESIQAVPSSPRWNTLTPEIIARLQKPVKRSYKKRSTSH